MKKEMKEVIEMLHTTKASPLETPTGIVHSHSSAGATECGYPDGSHCNCDCGYCPCGVCDSN